MRTILALVAVASVSAAVAADQAQPAVPSGYLLPPKPIVDILDAAPPPTVYLSSTGDAMAVLERDSMPSLAEIAQPMLRLGGIRINPRTNGLHRAVRYRTLSIKSPVDGTERKVTLPPSPAIRWIGFSPDGSRFAFMQTHDDRNELWVGRTATGQARAVTKLVDEGAPGVDPAVRKQAAASILAAVGFDTWVQLRDVWGMDAEQCVATMQWNVGAVLAQLAKASGKRR